MAIFAASSASSVAILAASFARYSVIVTTPMGGSLYLQRNGKCSKQDELYHLSLLLKLTQQDPSHVRYGSPLTQFVYPKLLWSDQTNVPSTSQSLAPIKIAPSFSKECANSFSLAQWIDASSPPFCLQT